MTSDRDEPQILKHPAVTGNERPVFGFIVPGGPINGAAVRDLRLANELATRGHEVHLWWVLDRTQSPTPALNARIQQHWLFHGFRFMGRGPRGLKDWAGQAMAQIFKDKNRTRLVQNHPRILRNMWHGLVRHVCQGVESDPALVRRFASQISATGVTHLLPTLEIFCPWAAAAKRLVAHRLRYAVTFQGYEVYSNYARELNCEQAFYTKLAETARNSDWPAIAVSEDYAQRIVEDIGLARESLAAIPPGVPVASPLDREQAIQVVASHFPGYRRDLPTISFVGRRDTEKGIDLLLYATKILARRDRELQLFVCGASAFGNLYSKVCAQIAEELRIHVHWRQFVPDELRSALFAASRCVVYPSIHREPFGMVPVEALAQGTPAIVPDYGGVASAIRAPDAVGGLTFTSWDSGNLAERIEQLVENDALHATLSAAGPRVAEYYSVARMTDRMLAHLGVAESTAQAAPRKPTLRTRRAA